MRFYVCQDNDGNTFDCTRAFSEAKTIVKAAGGGIVVGVDVDITKQNIARLLGNLGGYGKNIKYHNIKED